MSLQNTKPQSYIWRHLTNNTGLPKSVSAMHPPSQPAGAGPPATLLKLVFCHPEHIHRFPTHLKMLVLPQAI